jgi:hypothetical protein
VVAITRCAHADDVLARTRCFVELLNKRSDISAKSRLAALEVLNDEISAAIARRDGRVH